MHRRHVISAALAAGAGTAISGPARARAAAPRKVRSSDGVELFHRDWGEGRPIVFVSSWALASEMWAYQVAHLADAGYRCISFDRRGHGRSSPAARGYDIDALADDLGSVLDQLDLREVTLVGHSMGGAEILRYLGRRGDARVRSIALLAPAAPCLLQRPDNPFGAPREAFEARIAEWLHDFPAWNRRNQAPFFTPETSSALQEWLVQQILQTSPEVAAATFRALYRADVRPDLPKVDRPLLILQGDRDVSAPLDITGRRVAAGVRGAELKVYEGAPHGLFVTHMDRVNRDLEAFLRA